MTCFLSIRSWYKPSIKLNEISPITVILDKEAEVIDVVASNKDKDKAKLEAIQNSRNKQLLEIDNQAAEESSRNMEFLIKLARKEISSAGISELALINSKVSLETQEELRNLDESSWNEFKSAIKRLPESMDEPIYVKYSKDIDKLIDIEKSQFIKELGSIRADDQRINDAKSSLGKYFFDNLKRENAEGIFSQAKAIQRKLLDLGVVNGLPRDKIKQNIKILYPGLTRNEQALVQLLIDQSTLPNIKIDWRRVHEVEQEAMDGVLDTVITLKKGSVIAQKGQIVSEKNFHFAKQLNLLNPKPDGKQILYNFFLIATIIGLVGLFLTLTKLRKFTTSEVIMLVVVSVGLSAIIALISIWGINKLVMTPLAAIALLLTVFYTPIMAATMSTLMAFLLLTSFDLNFWQVLPLFVGSIYAIFLTRKAHQREDLTRAGTKIALAQMVVFGLTTVIAAQSFEIMTVLIIAALYALSGILSGFITLAVLPYLESGLGLLTPFRLVELSNPNQPLLKKLKEEAPGTYQHSLNVSHLAEEACKSIGGNLELIRIGLLYHDIGKTYKADYFIENLMGKPNPHTTLDDPLESAKIIIEHIPEGNRLAKKYNLPQAVADYIPMHQGTTVTGYFYHQAQERYGTVNPEDYRYPGPSPNTKETGIAMLADSVEAAMTSMKRDNADDVTVMNTINKIISSRLNEGELDKTGLSRAELDQIAEAFLRIWKSKNHERVKYPDAQNDPV